MTTDWPVRTLSEADEPAFHRIDSLAFGESVPQELIDAELPLHEQERKIGALDGDALVGIAMAYSYRMSVPGGELPTAGVSWVGVAPTHRRRGVLSALMRHQLRDIHERHREPLAALWASEPMIYGRFGYGLATRRYALSVPRSATALHRWAPEDESLRLRYVDAGDWKVTAEVYATVARERGGMPERDGRWWERAVRDLPSAREGRSALRCVVAEDDQGVRGYARYSTKQEWDDVPQGDVRVRECLASDSAALAALYRFLFDQDLMSKTELWNVPVDDPLLHWLANPRTAKPRLADSLFIRVVDVGAALAARSYSAPVDAVVEVEDDVCPWNAGRWRLTADTEGARCERTDDPADVTAPVVALGAAYLGGTSLQELAVAGLVREERPGAVAALDAGFRWFPAPWSPQVF